MRVHHYLPAFGRVAMDPVNGAQSGVVQAAVQIGRRLAALGDDVSLTGWSEGKSRHTTTPEGLSVHTHPGWPGGRAGPYDVRWLAPMLLKGLRKPRPDVLHVHVDPNLLRLPGRIKVLHLQTPPGVGEASPAYLRLLQQADLVVACSTFVGDQFLKVTGCNPRKVVAVPNGTDVARFRPFRPEERARARSMFGLSSQDFVVLYAGAVVENKGVLFLARAMRTVCEKFPDARLVVAGLGGLWGQLGGRVGSPDWYEAKVTQEAPAGSLLLQKQPNAIMPDLYGAADLLVVPSVWEEPLGMVAVDALAAGLPTVASRAGGLSEVVAGGVTGILLPPADETALADAITRLRADPALRARLGAEARRRSPLFSWERIVRDLRDAYIMALDRKARL
ncbi:MAG: glycosyltransferase family 4 protein [Chloroflexota bacterium]